jgi:hypothetical protein
VNAEALVDTEKAVDQRAALAMVIFVAVGVAIGAVDLINHAGALLVATGASYSTALGAGAPDGLVLLFVDLYRAGHFIAQIFYALWLLPAGNLLYRSGWFPKALGVLVAVGCFSLLAETVVVSRPPASRSRTSRCSCSCLRLSRRSRSWSGWR